MFNKNRENLKDKLNKIIEDHRITCALAFKNKSSDKELTDEILPFVQSYCTARRLSEGEIDKIAEDFFRSYYIPLYPKDKPVSTMTPYEQGIYKGIFSEVRTIAYAIFKKQEEEQEQKDK